jgi:dihydropteroate synthase
MFQPKSINCKGQLLDLSEPKVMGILNVTPDSFFDGGRYQNEKKTLSQVERMLNDGASIIDVGGMSSRPGAKIISVEEELQRVVPVIDLIIKNFPQTVISIDTIRAKVAKKSVEHGASIINDISAGNIDSELFQTVADLGVPYILMHMKGTPETMQKNVQYDNIVLEVTDFMIKKIGELRELGVKDIILDAGFGFGKTVDHNYQLLKYMHQFQIMDLPILAGVSRKSMICKVLDIEPKDALNGTTALHLVALQQGAKLLRVHDVKEAVEVVKLWQQLGKI